jgi:hypothetical protein
VSFNLDTLFINNYWRPKPEFLYGLNAKNIPELLNHVCTTFFFVNNNPDIDINNDISAHGAVYSTINVDIPGCVTYKLQDEIYNIPKYTYKILEINNLYGSKESFRALVNHKTEKNSIGISELNFDTNYKYYNRTRPPVPDTSNQYITSVVMLQPSRLNQYRFRTDCCRLDMRTYFQNNVFSSGVAINAAFFNWKTDYESIGLYKSNNYITDNPISREYKNYYGSVVIDSVTNRLEITSVENARTNINNYDYIITAGPILIQDEVIVLADTL